MPQQPGFNYSIDSATDGVSDSKWLKLFPNCVADPDRSSNFMTRAMFVAFSLILNRRKILGPEYFSPNYITEKLKVQSLNFALPEAHAIACKLRAAGEAIKKGYLDELALVITKHEGDTEAMEVFRFKMAYFEDGGVAAHFNVTDNNNNMSPLERLGQTPYDGTASVRDQLVMLARAVHVLCYKVLAPLPEMFSANFRINYTSEAPEKYRVDGFYDTSDFYILHHDVQDATLGHLRPGYHGALVNCSSLFMEDSFQAEMILKRFGDKLADELGHASNNTLYGSFVSEGSKSSAEESEAVNTSTASSADLANEFNGMALKQPTGQKTRARKNVEKSPPTRVQADRLKKKYANK